MCLVASISNREGYHHNFVVISLLTASFKFQSIFKETRMMNDKLLKKSQF